MFEDTKQENVKEKTTEDKAEDAVVDEEDDETTVEVYTPKYLHFYWNFVKTKDTFGHNMKQYISLKFW